MKSQNSFSSLFGVIMPVILCAASTITLPNAGVKPTATNVLADLFPPKSTPTLMSCNGGQISKYYRAGFSVNVG